MDQQHREAEDMDDNFEPESYDESPAENPASPDTFYIAMKLALARLKEYSATTTG